MSTSRRLTLISFVAMATLTAGCASINKAPAEANARAKEFRADPALSQVYVYRNESLGALVQMPLTVNGKLAGSTGAFTFFRFELPPGKHTLTSQGDTSKLELATEAGQSYFVWQEVKMGVFSGGSKLQLVPEAAGKKGVLECALLQPAP
jgi:Protein of unknown function (DUF2846)